MNTLDYKSLVLGNVTHYDDLEEFLSFRNMTVDEFAEDIEDGFIMCITRGTYNGATESFMPWELSDSTLLDTILEEEHESEFKTIFWDYEEGSEDDPATWSDLEAAYMFTLFYEVITIANDVYTLAK